MTTQQKQEHSAALDGLALLAHSAAAETEADALRSYLVEARQVYRKTAWELGADSSDTKEARRVVETIEKRLGVPL